MKYININTLNQYKYFVSIYMLFSYVTKLIYQKEINIPVSYIIQ